MPGASTRRSIARYIPGRITTVDSRSIHGGPQSRPSACPHAPPIVARGIRAGTVHLTGHGLDTAAPFGGYKQSGLGREWGAFGVEEYLEVKAVMGHG